MAGGKILPSRIALPWEIEVGGALELGTRTLNPVWVNPAIEENVIRARYRKPGHSRPDAKDRAAMEAELKALEERRTAERHRQQRQTAIVMASLLFTGGEPNAVSITGFIDQQRIPYGSRFSVSPRIGVEAEMIKNWLMVRAGSYLEPSLFEDVPYRAHFTGRPGSSSSSCSTPSGSSESDPWRIRLAADGAARYFNTSFSLGKYY